MLLFHKLNCAQLWMHLFHLFFFNVPHNTVWRSCGTVFMSRDSSRVRVGLLQSTSSYFSSPEVIWISILHQAWSWLSGLKSQMVSRRQPIYRLAWMVDVTCSRSAVHLSPATQHRLSWASQHSPCLSNNGHFPLSPLLLPVCFLSASEVPASALIKVLMWAFVLRCSAFYARKEVRHDDY